MPISKANLEEIANDKRISPEARQVLFAFFGHDSAESDKDGRWAALRQWLQELEGAHYVIRGDAWKGQVGGHLLVFDRPQEPTVPMPLPELPLSGSHETVVYVIGQPGTSIVKIGVTRGLRNRLRGIQTGSPVPVVVRWWCTADSQLEIDLHERFADFRMNGEWFNFGVEEPEVLVEMAVRELRPGLLPPLLDL